MTRTWTCPVCERPGYECLCGVDKSPEILGGSWRVRHTRISVATVWWARHSGYDMERIGESWPSLLPQTVDRIFRWLDNGGAAVMAAEDAKTASYNLREDLEIFARRVTTLRLERAAYDELVKAEAELAWNLAQGDMTEAMDGSG